MVGLGGVGVVGTRTWKEHEENMCKQHRMLNALKMNRKALTQKENPVPADKSQTLP